MRNGTAVARMLAAAVGLLVSAASLAQAYPDRPIRLVVPLAPGGTTDSVGRLIAANLSTRLGKQVVVENRAGAGTQIGMEYSMRAAPDGYTLVVGGVDGLSVMPAMKKKAPFDPVRDFTPVSQMAVAPLAFAVTSKFAPNTIAELIAYARAKPGAVRYGSPGVGTILHLGVEWLQSSTGTEMTHVPYKGGGPMMQAVVAAEVELVMTSADFAKQFIGTGQLKGLAQADRKRHPLLPNVPTTADAGFPDIQIVAWFGILGPAGLPRAVVDRLAKEVESVLEDSVLRERMEMVGSTAAYMPPNDFGKYIAEEAKKWERIVRDARIPLQD